MRSSDCIQTERNEPGQGRVLINLCSKHSQLRTMIGRQIHSSHLPGSVSATYKISLWSTPLLNWRTTRRVTRGKHNGVRHSNEILAAIAATLAAELADIALKRIGLTTDNAKLPHALIKAATAALAAILTERMLAGSSDRSIAVSPTSMPQRVFATKPTATLADAS